MADITLSPDGKFMWNGSEWIPAPPVSNEPTNSPPGRATDISDSVISINIDNNPQKNNTMANTFGQSAEIPANLQLQTYAPGIYLGVFSLLTIAIGMFIFDPINRMILTLIPELNNIEIPSEVIEIFAQIRIIGTIVMFLLFVAIIYIFVMSLIGKIPPKKLWNLSSQSFSILLIFEIIGFGLDLITNDSPSISGVFMIVAFILLFQKTSPDEMAELLNK